MPSSSNKLLPALLLLGGALLSLGAKGAKRFMSPLKSGKIVSKFGSRLDPFGEGKEFHNGLDIAVPEGTNIFAIAPGRVIKSYYTEKGGKQLVVSHNNGFKSGYAHLKTSLKEIGGKVERGEVIALTGATGRVTGAHLHFTLRNPKGEYVNPEKYIRFRA